MPLIAVTLPSHRRHPLVLSGSVFWPKYASFNHGNSPLLMPLVCRIKSRSSGNVLSLSSSNVLAYASLKNVTWILCVSRSGGLLTLGLLVAFATFGLFVLLAICSIPCPHGSSVLFRAPTVEDLLSLCMVSSSNRLPGPFECFQGPGFFTRASHPVAALPLQQCCCNGRARSLSRRALVRGA